MSRRDHHAARRMSEPRGGSKPSGKLALVGLSNFTAANYLQTAAGGGEAGVGTGFGFVSLVRLDALVAATRTLSQRYNGSSQGWQHYISAANQYLAFAPNNSSVAGSYTFTASDVGKLFLLWGLHSGAGNQIVAIVNRVAVSVGAQVGYPADPGPMVLGQLAGAAPATGLTELAHLTFRGVPTAGQIAAFADAVRARGDVPESMDGATVTHRHSLRDELRGTVIVDGQTAPAQLTDTVTRAPVDALVRQGSPVVRVIDAASDGRRTLGAQGFSASNYLTTAGGMSGAQSGMWWSWFGVLPSVIALDGVLVGKYMSGQGYNLRCDGTNIAAITVTSGGTAAAVFTHAAHRLVPKVFSAVYTGTALTLYADGVQIATATTTGAYIAPSVPYRVGVDGNGLSKQSDMSWFGDAAGLGVPTPAQMQAHAAATLAAGRMQAIDGLTSMLHDPTQDTLASGVDAVPTVVLDRVGTDHLTRVNGQISDTGKFVGLTAPGPTSKLARVGTLGTVANQSFHVQLAWRIDQQTGLASRFRTPFCHLIPGPPTRMGWDFTSTVMNSGIFAFEVAVVGGAVAASTLDISGLLGQTKLYTGVYDAGAGTLTMYADGVIVGTPQPCASYLPTTPDALENVLNNHGSAYPSDGSTVFAVGGGQNTIPTPAELVTQAAAFQATGIVPEIPGKTTALCNFKPDLTAGVIPAQFADAKSGQPLIAAGLSNLVLAQRTERLWSYEATPILYGATPTSLSDYYATTNPLLHSGGTGDWFALLYQVLSQSVATATRVMAGTSNAASTSGFYFCTSGTNSLMNFAAANAVGGFITAPVQPIAAADVGKLLLAVGIVDGAKVRLALKRVEVGSGTAGVGFTPGGPLNLLRDPRVNFLADGLRVYGFAAGFGVPSMAEIQALYDSCMACEDITSIPSRTSFRVSFKNAGGTPPAVLTDQIGTEHMARYGTPTISAQHARAWGW